MNKFFEYTDESINEIGNFWMPPKSIWWSRHYEFALALKYFDKDEHNMYASYDHAEPLKTYLKDNSINFSDYEVIYEKNSIDKIFCIGYLEHSPNKLEILKNFEYALKDNGMIIITADYPLLKPTDLIKIASQTNLKIEGNMNYLLNENKVLKSNYHNLRCFSMILKKNKISNEININYQPKIEYDKKVISPEETKKKSKFKKIIK